MNLGPTLRRLPRKDTDQLHRRCFVPLSIRKSKLIFGHGRDPELNELGIQSEHEAGRAKLIDRDRGVVEAQRLEADLRHVRRLFAETLLGLNLIPERIPNSLRRDDKIDVLAPEPR